MLAIRTIWLVLPAMTQSAEVCTLEVEAVVIDNKSDLKSDSDYGQSLYAGIDQVGEYAVDR